MYVKKISIQFLAGRRRIETRKTNEMQQLNFGFTTLLIQELVAEVVINICEGKISAFGFEVSTFNFLALLLKLQILQVMVLQNKHINVGIIYNIRDFAEMIFGCPLIERM